MGTDKPAQNERPDEQTSVTLTVKSGRGDDPREFTFPQETMVGDAAQEAADDFGLTGNNPTFVHDGTPLEQQRPLVSYDLDGATVILSTNDGGV